MITTPKSGTQYASELLTALAATGIRQLSPGGKARAFCDAVAAKLGESGRQLVRNVSLTSKGNMLQGLGPARRALRYPPPANRCRAGASQPCSKPRR